MAVSKRGHIYHYEFELGGRRHRGSTKRTNRQGALKVEATQRTRLLDSIQGIPNPTAVPTFAELADQFLNWAKTNLADATVVLHRVNIDRLKQFFRGKLINEIDRKSVEEFKVWRAGQKRKNADSKVSGATVNRCLTTLKRIFNHADAMGLKLQAHVEAARRAKQLQEEREAEELKPKEDEWGMPILESEASSPQKSTHGAEIEDLPF